MANLNTQSFTQLVQGWAQVVQGAAAQLVDFTVGSILLAVDQATAFVAMWLQSLILQAAALARAATSNGSDLDSFFAQFGFYRLAGVAATMQETFARYTATAQAVVPIGATVQSSDGSIVFTVIVDTTNVNYSAALGGYVLPAGTASINVTVQCTQVGTVGNVSINTITQLATAISGVDYVTNPAATVNGIAVETDPAFRSRFVLFIASLSRGTLAAVYAAIASVQQGLTDTVAQNQTYNGTYQPGYFTVVVDDGSGAPPTQLLTNVAAAVEAVRPICSAYSIHGPTTITANVVMAITTAAGYLHATYVTLVQNAVSAYIQSLGVNQSLSYSYLATLAYQAAPGIVTDVTGVLLNGGTSDLASGTQNKIVPGTIVVS